MATKADVYAALAPVYDWQDESNRENSISPLVKTQSMSKSVDVVLLSVDESEDIVPQHYQKQVRFSEDSVSTAPIGSNAAMDADVDAAYESVLPMIKGIMAMSGLQLNSSIKDRMGVDGMIAMSTLKSGVYLTRFDRSEGTVENFFQIVSDYQHQPISFHSLQSAAIPWYLQAAPAEEFPQKFPLNSLFGVQKGVQTNGFKYVVTSSGYAKGVKSKGKRALIPARLCFTLWFKSPDGSFSPMTLAAVNDQVFNSCMAGFNTIRSLNSTHNYTLQENIHHNVGSPHDITKWVPYNGGTCEIL